MSEPFESKLAACAIAGWWALLIGGIFLTLQWIVYLIVISVHPAWILSMLGGGSEWETVRNVWLWCAAVFKMYLWMLAVVVVWLTLWSRRLRKKNTGTS